MSPPCGNWGSKDDRLHLVENVDEVAQDFERRLKPPFISIPGQEFDDRLTPQQRSGLDGVFNHRPEDFRDCTLIHTYAEPLEVLDAMHVADALKGYISKGESDSEQGKEREALGLRQPFELPGAPPENRTKEREAQEVYVRPGPVFDDDTVHSDGGKELHISTEMFARLDDLSNPVQLIPHGTMSTWHSLWKVPIAGFLCLNAEKSDSAPVLYATPTPCVQASVDAEGNQLNPDGDAYEVWIGSTRLAFPNKTAAEVLCQGLVEEIGRNLEVLDWDAEAVREYLLRHPKVATPVAASTTPNSSNTSNLAMPDRSTGGQSDKANRTLPVANVSTGKPPVTNAKAVHSFAQASLFASTAIASDVDMLDIPGDGEDVATKGIDNMVTPMAPDLQSFIRLAGKRGQPEGWTKGAKKLLVVVMDWRPGDNTLKPYSKQEQNAVQLWKNNIVPKAVKILQDMSYGQLRLIPHVVPEVIHYTHNRNQMTGKLPFPTLYENAQTALQGHPKYGKTYKFKDFNLVFVIAPQVNPMGTKGVAWVGSRGAVCNGCESCPDSKKVMVMVHELGHNLGLAHASSEAVDYGNIFDWMGNSPEVQGLHYGLGYVLELGWLPPSSVLQITDKNVHGTNDVVTVTPFDTTRLPEKGQVVGMKISLEANSNDIYVSFRGQVAAQHRGVYVTYQDKFSPNSRLMDAACHTPSQQDAPLKKGWLYMDPSNNVVVSVIDVQVNFAKVHVWKTPGRSENIALIRKREGFTDGKTRCPPTCQDSDLVISRSCSDMKKQGYCGQQAYIHVHGRNMQIATELCPQTCNKCSEVLASMTPEVGEAACMDKPVMISGLDCPAIAQRDACGMKTTAGKQVGRDFCPRSCGQCPRPLPEEPSSSKAWQHDPKPTRWVGFALQGVEEAGVLTAELAEEAAEKDAEREKQFELHGATTTAGATGTQTEQQLELDIAAATAAQQVPTAAPECGLRVGTRVAWGGLSNNSIVCASKSGITYGICRGDGKGNDNWQYCEFEPVIKCHGRLWFVDCIEVYALEGKSTDATAKEALMKSKSQVSDACEDDPLWEDIDGNGCQVYANSVPRMGRKGVCEHNGGAGALHCRKTCGTCKGAEGKCVDNVCIETWMDKFGICYECSDYSKMCTDPEYQVLFAQECPYTCGTCGDGRHDYGDSVFHYNGTGRTYSESAEYCKSKDMVIASIRNEDEQKQVEALVEDGAAYIGGTSEGNGNWTWVDGSPWVYQNPDNDGLHGGAETYLAVSESGMWHDVNGEEHYGVLCREKTPPCVDEDPKDCEENGMEFCSGKDFQKRCQRTCQLCWDSAPARQACVDSLDQFTCTRYKEYGWCDREDTKAQVQQNCRLTCGACEDDHAQGILGKLTRLRRKLCNKRSVHAEPATHSSAVGSSGVLAALLLVVIAAL